MATLKFSEKISRLQEVAIKKDLPNEELGFNYRNAERIISAIKPTMKELGLTLTTTYNVKELPVSGRVYVEAVATISDGEQSISAAAQAREDTSYNNLFGGQITGVAASYALKYALGGLLAFDDRVDYDGQQNPSPVSKNIMDITAGTTPCEAPKPEEKKKETGKAKFAFTPEEIAAVCAEAEALVEEANANKNKKAAKKTPKEVAIEEAPQTKVAPMSLEEAESYVIEKGSRAGERLLDYVKQGDVDWIQYSLKIAKEKGMTTNFERAATTLLEHYQS